MDYWQQTVPLYESKEPRSRYVSAKWRHKGDADLSLILTGVEQEDDICGRTSDVFFELACVDPGSEGVAVLTTYVTSPKELAQCFRELSPLLPLPKNYKYVFEQARKILQLE